MTETNRWTALCDALTAEVERLHQLEAHAASGAEIILRMDVPGLEAWTARQKELLGELAAHSDQRSEAASACLPGGGLPRARGGLAERITFLSLFTFAPARIVDQLRGLRDRVSGLRDQLALVTSRNEVLLQQVLAFTDDLGRSLTTTPPTGYDARGRLAGAGDGAGELLDLSL